MMKRGWCTLTSFFAVQETARVRKAKKICMPSQFVAAQQREMAMRNAREARFLSIFQSEKVDSFLGFFLWNEILSREFVNLTYSSDY